MNRHTNTLRAATLVATLLALPLLAADPQVTPRADATTDATSWSSGAYEYDGAGNIKKIDEDVYRYDAFGRLTSAGAKTTASPVNHQNFTYDRYGNILTVTTTITTPTGTANELASYAVNGATNQLNNSTTCVPGATSCRLGIYDAAGNQVGTTAGPGEFQWDALGVMTELDSHRGDRHERYIYDASDERILVVAKAADGAETERRYAIRGVDNKVARDLTYIPSTNTWTPPKDYVYRGGALISSFSTPTAATPDRHYHVDHLGSTRLMTDADSKRIAVHIYWPFGQEAPGSDVDAGRMKFTGHERDGSVATGGLELDYMHARYYDANLNRFLSVDPTWESADVSAPQSWNRYAYVRNNPSNLTDPDGRNPGAAVAGGGLVAGGILALRVCASNPGCVRSVIAAGVGLYNLYEEMSAGPEQIDGEIIINGNDHPEAAQHIDEAQAAGQPAVITVDRGGAKGRRKEATKDTPTKPNKDRDEYPPAVAEEGGAGSSVKHIKPGDNRGAGASMGQQLRKYADGARVVIRTIWTLILQ